MSILVLLHLTVSLGKLSIDRLLSPRVNYGLATAYVINGLRKVQRVRENLWWSSSAYPSEGNHS